MTKTVRLDCKREKFKKVIDKVKNADFKEYKDMEGTLDDGLSVLIIGFRPFDNPNKSYR